ncbi:MAG: hypothetical protein EXS13_01250 [Planctomycetes bacterium]|nr:hypothetical protein [Planctomycetota bacterium]
MNEVPAVSATVRAATLELPVPPFPWTENVEFVLARYERQLINHALANADHVKRRAAMLLGISRYALERRLIRVAQLLDGTPAPKNKAATGGTQSS